MQQTFSDLVKEKLKLKNFLLLSEVKSEESFPRKLHKFELWIKFKEIQGAQGSSMHFSAPLNPAQSK